MRNESKIGLTAPCLDSDKADYRYKDYYNDFKEQK